ncbi:MAG: response regulator [Chitinophagaceae bacterium]
MNDWKTIYLLEDNIDLCTLVADALLAAGYRVLSFPSIQAFHRKMVKPLPDLFILDMHLPYADGSVVVERLMEMSPVVIPPVIVMSSTVDNGVASLTLGKRFFMPKPFHMDVLLATVKRLLKV